MLYFPIVFSLDKRILLQKVGKKVLITIDLLDVDDSYDRGTAELITFCPMPHNFLSNGGFPPSSWGANEDHMIASACLGLNCVTQAGE